MSALFSVIGPVPTPEELVLLERNHDEWLDYRTALILFTEAMRQRVAENSAANFAELKAIQRKLSGWSAAAFASGLAALAMPWSILVFLHPRPVPPLVRATPPLATGSHRPESPRA